MRAQIWMVCLLTAVLFGCAGNAVISDIGQDKVKVVPNAFADQAMILAKANEGCGLYNRTAVPISKRCLDAYCTQSEYLFACKPSLSQTSVSSGNDDLGYVCRGGVRCAEPDD